MQCCIAIEAAQAYLTIGTFQKVMTMSKQLKLSAALSLVLMTGFAAVSQFGALLTAQPLIGG